MAPEGTANAGDVYVGNYGDGTVQVFDGAGTLLNTINLPGFLPPGPSDRSLNVGNGLLVNSNGKDLKAHRLGSWQTPTRYRPRGLARAYLGSPMRRT